ncbi:MAG: DegT/DnrJ/EryC1/StrS family aminotransferase [Pseudomonadales bacterium]
MTVGFSPWPSFTVEEAEAVRRVLLSNAVNQWTGSAVREFEEAFAASCGAGYALALSNGTTALDAALRALNIGPGDEVIVTPRSFVASASSVVAAGATPVFADVDANSELITPETVAPRLTSRTRAILCVHLAGWPCDMDGFRELVDGRQIALIEDCAQAHGAKYRGRSVGTLGDVGCWSFCQDKIITTGGEGGMLTTNDESLYRSAWSYRDHGKSYESVFETVHPPGYRWQHARIGTNARMTSMQAVIGTIQLGRLQAWHEARARNAARIRDAAIAAPGLRVPIVPSDVEHAWYRCDVFVRADQLKTEWNRDRVLAAISERGVPCLVGPCPEIYREQAFVELGLGPDHRLEQARALGETCLMFLVHPTLTDAEIDLTTAALQETLAEAARG